MWTQLYRANFARGRSIIPLHDGQNRRGTGRLTGGMPLNESLYVEKVKKLDQDRQLEHLNCILTL